MPAFSLVSLCLICLTEISIDTCPDIDLYHPDISITRISLPDLFKLDTWTSLSYPDNRDENFDSCELEMDD